MPTYLYYQNAFGVSADDLTAIPMNAAVDGSVSYLNGWTDPYEYDLNTNPAALPIPRGQMNQLFYDITNNIQQYQNYGTPMWVSTAQVPGSAAGYPIYARVYYSGAIYENQVALNTATPGVDATWLKISGSSDGIQTGMIMDYAGPVAPSGYLFCDGSQQSRSTYANLFAAITQHQTGNATSTSSGQVTGLTNALTTMYPGMAIESANFSGGTVISSITNNTTVVMSTNALTSGSAPITFFNWGNGNGTTTFNVPDFRNRVTANEGGTLLGNASGQVDVVGQTTGAASVTLTNANLPTALGASTISNVGSGGIPVYNSAGSGTGSQGFTNAGGGNATSLLQPTAIVQKIIKT